jgi:tripartite-type tricarboxylate transporter receptor subunit TctC
MQRRHFTLQATALALAPFLNGATWAQGTAAWPDKPIKWTLSQPPGSGPDTVARLLGEPLAKVLGQPVVIDNKPGGQNIIGAQTAARATPDGSNFYFATTAALVTNSYLFKTLPYDPRKDFIPVAFIGKSPFAVLVRNESPITSMQDLVARSRANPDTVSLANEGPRTFGGIIARLINARTDARTNLVAYSSVSTAVTNVVGGQADALVADLASTAQLARQGRLRVLAVTTPKRLPAWPQVPALSELIAGFDMSGWFAVVAPAGTPAPVVARMHKEINTLLAQPEIAEKILAIGPIAEPLATPDAVAAFLADEHRRWGEATKEIGLLPE